jgi:hypothetical protein
MGKQKIIKVLSVVTALVLISVIIYSIVNQNWLDALGYSAIFFIVIILPGFFEKTNKK